MKGVVIIACYHPLKRFILGYEYDNETGERKSIGYVTSFLVSELYKIKISSQIIKIYDNYKPSSPNTILPNGNVRVTEYDLVPCGTCVGCTISKSKDWANRCMLELLYHESSYFLTLTYNDAHIPKSFYVDEYTGEVFEPATLLKKDFQDFMKRLRKRFSNCELRFFMCGEYGSKTFRPHYHAIIFGLKLNDLVYYKRSDNGDAYYTSQSLQDTWSIYNRKTGEYEPLGHVVVGKVTWETCAYTARYVMKKSDGVNKKFYSDMHISPEFTLQSRKPGIGFRYFYEHAEDIYKYKYINLSTDKGGKQFFPPKYFDRLAPKYGIDIESVKEERKLQMENAINLKLSQTNLSYLELLRVEEENLRSRIQALKEGRTLL